MIDTASDVVNVYHWQSQTYTQDAVTSVLMGWCLLDKLYLAKLYITPNIYLYVASVKKHFA